MDLNFLKPWQSNISDDLRKKLSGASKAFGSPLTITSGYRPKAYNKKVGGAKNSYHVRRGAADIDMSKLDDAGRAKLVDTLRKAGLTGFGTYDKSPDMLHVDNRPTVNFMHNKSRDHLAKAPQWFQKLAAGNAPTMPAAVAPQMQVSVSGPGAPAPEPNQPPLPPMQGGGPTLPSSMFEGPLNELMSKVPANFVQGAMMPGRHPPVPTLSPGMQAPPSGPSGHMPPSMMAEAPKMPTTKDIGGLMQAIGGGTGGGDQQGLQQAAQQGQADFQRRMQWAMANGFGRGLV